MVTIDEILNEVLNYTAEKKGVKVASGKISVTDNHGFKGFNVEMTLKKAENQVFFASFGIDSEEIVFSNAQISTNTPLSAWYNVFIKSVEKHFKEYLYKFWYKLLEP